MKQRKIPVILMILVMILAVSGCGKEDSAAKPAETPYEFYREVSENMKQVRDSEMEGTIAVTMPDSEKQPMISMNYDVKLVRHSENDMDMAMHLNQMGTKFSTYYTDGFLYTDSGYAKIKTKMDIEDAVKMTGSLDLSRITQEMLQDAKLSRKGKNTVLSYTLSADQAQELLTSSLGTSEAAASLQNLSDLVTFGDMNVTLTADENKMMKSSEMEIPLEFSGALPKIGGSSEKSAEDSQDSAAKMTCKITAKWLSINEGIAISFPDFSGYQEATV